MDLNLQKKIIDQMIAINQEATIGDYIRTMARMERWQRNFPAIIGRMLWPHLSSVVRRNWPKAKVFDDKLFSMDEIERNLWHSRDQAFREFLKRKNKRA